MQEYQQNGHDFLISVMRDPLILERLVGLDELKTQTEAVDVEWDDEDL